MACVSGFLLKKANAELWRRFFSRYGNDNGTVETGYHHLKDDGGTLRFRGRDFVDTVATGSKATTLYAASGRTGCAGADEFRLWKGA